MIKILLNTFFLFSVVNANESTAYDIMDNVYQARKPQTSIMEVRLEVTRKKKGKKKSKNKRVY